jgi:hypothetical protein
MARPEGATVAIAVAHESRMRRLSPTIHQSTQPDRARLAPVDSGVAEG